MNELPVASNEKINVSILAFNDLHGHLEPPSLSVRERIDGNLTEVPAGGAAYLAAAIQHYTGCFLESSNLNLFCLFHDLLSARKL